MSEERKRAGWAEWTIPVLFAALIIVLGVEAASWLADHDFFPDSIRRVIHDD